MKYLVMAARRGLVHRHICTSVRAAAVATRFYRKAGWAVTVLPALGG
jgi:hypothetical protein